MGSAQPFGVLLAERRRAAGLSQSQLARLSGLCRGTIANLEEGRTQPAADTRYQLAKVPALALHVEDTAEHKSAPPWIFTPLYSPLDMSREMDRLLNGPGGTFEQTFAYLDPQSARDYYDYANAPSYIETFREKFPVDEFAAAAMGRDKVWGLDLVALGVGDGKVETRLAHRLANLLSPGVDLRCYLLDISHPLLVEAYKRATVELQDVAPVFPIHGNFLDLRSVIALAYRADDRRRLWCMIGNTFGNLDHEPRFLDDLAACSHTGDLLLIDVDTVWADAKDRAAILATDPALLNKVPEPAARWLSGPLRRHCRDVRSIRLDVELTMRCPLPGSYQLTICATVKRIDGGTVKHNLFRFRRYTPDILAAELRDLGWRALRVLPYGPGQRQRKSGLLLERM